MEVIPNKTAAESGKQTVSTLALPSPETSRKKHGGSQLAATRSRLDINVNSGGTQIRMFDTRQEKAS